MLLLQLIVLCGKITLILGTVNYVFCHNYQDGEPITEVQTASARFSFHQDLSWLQVRLFSVEDVGIYSCRVENLAGNKTFTKTVELTAKALWRQRTLMQVLISIVIVTAALLLVLLLLTLFCCRRHKVKQDMCH